MDRSFSAVLNIYETCLFAIACTNYPANFHEIRSDRKFLNNKVFGPNATNFQ